MLKEYYSKKLTKEQSENRKKSLKELTSEPEFEPGELVIDQIVSLVESALVKKQLVKTQATMIRRISGAKRIELTEQIKQIIDKEW